LNIDDIPPYFPSNVYDNQINSTDWNKTIIPPPNMQQMQLTSLNSSNCANDNNTNTNSTLSLSSILNLASFNTNSNTSKNSFLPNAPNGLVLSHVTQNNFFTKSQYYFAPHNASNANNNNNNHGNDDFDNTSYFSSNLANNQTTYDLNSSFNNNNNNNNDNDYNHNEYDNATTSLSASNMPSIPTTAIPSSCQSVAMLTLVKLINNKCKFYMDIIEEAWFLDISQHPSIQSIFLMV